MAVPADSTGWLRFGEFRTWYRVTGTPDGDLPPLVVVHGGPGSTHDYLLNMTSLAKDGRAVVHYDQLGNGGSTRLPERGADFWTPELFLDELANLLESLGVSDRYVLFGQSWGGMLVARHAADRPTGLRGLIIANAPASYRLWRSEMEVLRAALPPGVDEALRAHEAAGTTDSAEYFEAMRVFYGRHVCRLDPWPRDYLASFMETADNPTVYSAMNGPSEFHVIGTLKDWSVEDRLPEISVPTLVLSGRHDEATPVTVRPFRDLIPDARWEIFENSSHVPHLEEPTRFHAVVSDFLTGLEK
ncbi:proline iminopeptidase-family hydrolase [Streptomyces geranii]|uniref:proline iminopeptidase-family hydrolase n=1 Tax=Streptomyces geranii TaxID=2058923 RepID=UPI000D02B256|nr:proline iminopeptidase-family hydrolase [Streptomyces geranii]